MGTAAPFADEDSFEEKVKCLPDEDLLTIWVESQELAAMLDNNTPGHDFPAANFEKAIVHELERRTSWKLCSGNTHSSFFQ